MADTWKFFTGFDDQQRTRLEVQSGTGPSYDSTISYNGRYSAYWDASGASVTGFDRIQNGELAATDLWGGGGTMDFLWCSFHLYFASLPAAGNFFYFTRLYISGGAHVYAFRVSETGTLDVYNGNVGTWQSSAATISTGTWYAISWWVRRNISTGVIARNAATGATVASKTHGSAPADTTYTWFEFGPWSASRGKPYVDNLVLEWSTADANVADPILTLSTQYAVGLLTAAGTGFYDGYSGTFTSVDDYPNDGDATYREQQAGGVAAFTQTLSPTSGLVAQVASIKAVLQFAFERQTGGTCNTATRMRSGSTDSDGGYATVSTAFVPRQRIRTVDPATASAWTQSGVDAVQIGIARNGGTFWSRVTNVGLELLYTTRAISRDRKISYYLDVNDPKRRIVDAETGDIVPYHAVRANRWLKFLGRLPTADVYDDLRADPSMFFIERKSYRWSDEGGEDLALEPASDFVQNLITGLTNISSGP